jgi:Flp pilus assembly protein TadG
MPTVRKSRQGGAVAVSFILLSVVLLGFVGLSLDVGRLYVSKTELQNAADTCALAAAGALTGGNVNQLTAAEDYGIAAGTRNLIGMQAIASTIARDDITFSATLGGTYQTKGAIGAPLTMRYVRCTLQEANIPTLLIHVVNLLPGQNIVPSTVRASAVASLEPSISNCALPVAICEVDILNKPAGTWIEGILQPGQSNIEGAFKWIKYPGYERKDQLESLITGEGQCDLNNSSTIQSHPGFIDAMLTAWNTRFGIYRPGGANVTEARPDRTGWVYNPTLFPAKFNALPDYEYRKSQIPPHQSNPPYNLANPNNWATDAEFQNGIDKRRLVVGPVVDCPALGSNGTTAIKGWACYLMLNPVFKSGDTMYLEYRGSAEDIASGCVTSGAPGGPSAGGPKVPTLVQ